MTWNGDRYSQDRRESNDASIAAIVPGSVAFSRAGINPRAEPRSVVSVAGYPTGVLHELCKAGTPVLWTNAKTLSGVSPAPAITSIRPAACATRLRMTPLPPTASGAPPEVRTRIKPSSIAFSRAAWKSGARSGLAGFRREKLLARKSLLNRKLRGPCAD